MGFQPVFGFKLLVAAIALPRVSIKMFRNFLFGAKFLFTLWEATEILYFFRHIVNYRSTILSESKLALSRCRCYACQPDICDPKKGSTFVSDVWVGSYLLDLRLLQKKK